MAVRAICLAAAASLLSVAAHAAPDLTPDVTELASSGTVKIRNPGTDPAGPSVATIVCQKQGGGSCPEAPGMAAYENAAYPNAVVVAVPAVPAGQVHSHTLSFWGDLDWLPGTYTLTVKVDAGAAVAEGNEGNNQTVARKTVLPASVGTRPERPGGFASRPGGRSQRMQPAANGVVVAGLPDIMGTSLGFGINGFTAWGTTTTIDEPGPGHVKATKAGPGKNLCLINTGMYRTFNKGDFAVGSFIDILYINGKAVHTRHVPGLAPGKAFDFENRDFLFKEGMNIIQVKMDANNNIAESDENNTFQVRAVVKIDCDGDGKIAGVPGGLKSPPSSPQRTAPSRSSPRRQMRMQDY